MGVRGCWCPGYQSDRTLLVIGRQAAQLLVLVNLNQPDNCKTLMGIWISQGLYGTFQVAHKLNIHVITHWGLDKMANMLKTAFSYTFYKMKIFIKMSLNLVPKGSDDIMSPLGVLMGWHWTGTKPLPTPVLTKISEMRCHHWATISWSMKKTFSCSRKIHIEKREILDVLFIKDIISPLRCLYQITLRDFVYFVNYDKSFQIKNFI